MNLTVSNLNTTGTKIRAVLQPYVFEEQRFFISFALQLLGGAKGITLKLGLV